MLYKHKHNWSWIEAQNSYVAQLRQKADNNQLELKIFIGELQTMALGGMFFFLKMSDGPVVPDGEICE